MATKKPIVEKMSYKLKTTCGSIMEYTGGRIDEGIFYAFTSLSPKERRDDLIAKLIEQNAKMTARETGEVTSDE